MTGNPLLISQPMDVEEMYSHEQLDAAEAAAGFAADATKLVGTLAQSNPALTTFTWTSKRFEEHVAVGVTNQIRLQIHVPFLPKWLIVSTRGFTIRLVESHVRVLLDDVDGDLFMGASWDAAASAGQLERFRIPCGRIRRGEELLLYVTTRPSLLTFKGQLRRFSAMIIGEELVERH